MFGSGQQLHNQLLPFSFYALFGQIYIGFDLTPRILSYSWFLKSGLSGVITKYLVCSVKSFHMVEPKIRYLLALHDLLHFYSLLSSTAAAVLQNLEVLQNLNLHMQSPKQLLSKELRRISTQTFGTSLLHNSFLSGILSCKCQLPCHPLCFYACLLSSIRYIFFTWVPSLCATFRKVPSDIRSGCMWCPPHGCPVSLGLSSHPAYFLMPENSHTFCSGYSGRVNPIAVTPSWPRS